MKRDSTAVSAVLLAAAMLAFALAAATAAGSQAPPIYEFGEIVVTGERPRVVDEVTTVDVVSAEEIARSGARTLDEAIALLPGLQLRRGAEGITLIDVRGLRSRNVLLLLDGVPLNSSFDGLFDPATLPVGHVARLKLTRGASSLLYGPGGNAGVLDVVTRAAGDVSDASLRLEAGSADSWDLGGRASLRRGDLGLVVAGSLRDRDGFELSGDFEPTSLEDGGRRLNSDRRDRSAFASLTYDAAADTRLGVSFDYRAGERGKPPVTEDFRASPFAPRARFERVEHDALSVHAALTHDAGPTLTLRPALYFNRAGELTDGFDDDSFSTQAAPGAFREDATTSTAGAGLQLALARGPRSLATFAVDWREERWDASGFEVVRAGGGRGGGGRGAPAPFTEERSARIASLAAEVELSPGGRFSAVLGGGYAGQSRAGVDDDDFNFLVGGTWALSDRASLRGSAARRIRFPTLRDLYGADRGNPELEAERTMSWEIAVERRTGSGSSSVELTLFRIDAEDFIQGRPGDVLRNLEETRRQGAELGGRQRFGEDLELTWSYTWLDAEDRSPDADVTTIQNQPEHKVALVVEHDLPLGLRLRGDVLFVADSFALSRTRPTRTMELGDYAVVGLGLDGSIAGDRLRLVGRVANLFDEDYVESIGFPAPGRTFFVGLELR